MSKSPIKQSKSTTKKTKTTDRSRATTKKTKTTDRSKATTQTTKSAKDGRDRGISTGFESIDLLLDRIGWLLGCPNAVTGPDEKTLTGVLFRTIAAAQARGERCAWIQVGGDIDAEDADKAGVDLDRLAVYKVEDESPHGVLVKVNALIARRRRFDVLVVDAMPSPSSRGWKKAVKEITVLTAALEHGKTACVYAMRISQRDSGGHGVGRDLGAGYTRRLARGTGVRIQLKASRSSSGRFQSVRATRSRGGMNAILGVDARGRIRSDRLSSEGLICLGFRTGILTEHTSRPGLVVFGKRRLGMDDGTAAMCLDTDARLARRLQKAIARALAENPDLVRTEA